MSTSYFRFWGVRGSYPAPHPTHVGVGGNTSCVEIRSGNHLLICDAGTGIINLGNALLRQKDIRSVTILLSHYHWDHISGLPFFTPAFLPDWQITFCGPGDNDANVEHMLSQQMKPPYFPVETESWQADIRYRSSDGEGFEIGPFHIFPIYAHHPGATFGYRIVANGQSVIFMPDNEIEMVGGSIDRRKAECDPDEQQLLENMKAEAEQQLVNQLANTDHLIHDAQYTPEDYEKKRGWGHSCYLVTAAIAAKADVRNLYLFHHDPAYDDAMIDDMCRQARATIRRAGATTACEIAKEGMQVEL